MKRTTAVAAIALAITIAATSAEPATPQKEAATVQAHIRALDQEWANAEDKRNEAALERLLDSNFVFVGTSGRLSDRASYIATVLSGDDKQSQTIAPDVVHIHRDTAVSVGLITVTNVTTGEPDSTKYRYTAVYVLRDGVWRAISCQVNASKPKSPSP
jgi:hypothetical protein